MPRKNANCLLGFRNTSDFNYLEFNHLFDGCVGKKIWKIIHPADGILHMYVGRKIGRKIIDCKSGLSDDLGEYMLYIKGDWNYFIHENIVGTSCLFADEVRSHYMHRVELFVEEIAQRIKSIKGVFIQEINRTITIIFDNDDRLEVMENGWGWVDLTHYMHY